MKVIATSFQDNRQMGEAEACYQVLPQLNMMVLGWHLNAVLALAVLLLTLGGMAWVFQNHVDLAVEYLGQLWTPS